MGLAAFHTGVALTLLTTRHDDCSGIAGRSVGRRADGAGPPEEGGGDGGRYYLGFNKGCHCRFPRAVALGTYKDLVHLVSLLPGNAVEEVKVNIRL